MENKRMGELLKGIISHSLYNNKANQKFLKTSLWDRRMKEHKSDASFLAPRHYPLPARLTYPTGAIL